MRKYKNYSEKIDEIKKYFGTFPPPFDPPWCLQVSTGRCGSNMLCEIVSSFFHGMTYDPPYPSMGTKDMKKMNPSQIWTPKSVPKKQYLYYNVSALDPNDLHIPLFLWFLKTSKVVMLSREDSLTHAISYYYAGLVWEREAFLGRKLEPNEILNCHQTPLDFQKLDITIESSIKSQKLIKKLIHNFVLRHKLLEVTHFDIFYGRTLETLKHLITFLERPLSHPINLRIHKQINYKNIPNRAEITGRYDRELIEMPCWVPNNLDTKKIDREVQDTYNDLIKLNILNTEVEEYENHA